MFALGFPRGAVVKNLPADAGDERDMGSIPRSGRPSGGGNGKPFQYYRLGESQRQRSLAGYSPCGHKVWDKTEQLSCTFPFSSNNLASHSPTNLNTCPQDMAWTGSAQQSNPLPREDSLLPSISFPQGHQAHDQTHPTLPASLWHLLQQLLLRVCSQHKDPPKPPLQDLRLTTGQCPLTHHTLTDVQAMPCLAGSSFSREGLNKQRTVPRKGGTLPRPSDLIAVFKSTLEGD